MYQNFLDDNKPIVDIIAKDIADQLSQQCIFKSEETMRITFILIEKLFADTLSSKMFESYQKEKRKHFPTISRI